MRAGICRKPPAWVGGHSWVLSLLRCTEAVPALSPLQLVEF